MELLQLRYFCDAAKTENFSTTAKKYNVPASNISQSIKRLETELGTTLFNRKTNSLSLNERGLGFFKKADTALKLLESARCDFTEDETRGKIKICVLANRRFALDAMETFRRLYPNVMISSYYNYMDEDYDITVADESFNGNFTEKTLIISEEIHLAVNKGNPLSLKNRITAREISHESFISMDTQSSMYRNTLLICEKLKIEPNIVMQSPDPEFVRKCVELNLGITFVPTISWQGLFSDSVTFKKVGDFGRNIYAYTGDSRIMRKSVKNFLEILKGSIEEFVK